MNLRFWLSLTILFVASTGSTSATVIDFDSPGDLSLFNQSTGSGSLAWSSSAGVGNGGGLTVPGFHDATYSEESFSLSQPQDTIAVSALFKTGQIGVVGSGSRETYGEVYLTPTPSGYPFDEDTAFVEISRTFQADSISGGPLPAGGGSFPGFSANFPVGTLQSNRWYKLGVEYELLAGGQLGWDVQVEDYGISGLSSLGEVMSTTQVTSDTLGLRFDPTLYAGFSAVGGSSQRVTAVDRFTVNAPPGPSGQLVIGSTFDAAYRPGNVQSITDGDISLVIGGIVGSESFPEQQPVLEFPLSDIPHGARIVSAQLRFDSNGSSGAPRIAVTGYEGDGLASLSDGTTKGELVALTDPESCCDDVVVSLFTNYVQSLASRGASHLGLRLRSTDLPQYLSFSSDEAILASGPVLELEFSTSASQGDFTGDGLANAADYTVWRDTLNSGTDLRADGDGNGVVDGADYIIWSQNYGATPLLDVVNSDFELGNLSGWETVATPNANISFGFPRVDSFDVDGDGTASPAMRIRAGQDRFLLGEVAGGGIQQLIYLEEGDYDLVADIASANTSSFGNSAPGRFELWLAGQVVDVIDMNGTSISGGQVLRDTLSGTVLNLTPGWYSLELRFLRPAVNSTAIYGYFDNIEINYANAATQFTTIPEPATSGLFLLGMSLILTTNRRFAKGTIEIMQTNFFPYCIPCHKQAQKE